MSELPELNWNFIECWTSNFKSHVLVEASDQRLEFHPAASGIFIFCLFSAIPTILLLGFITDARHHIFEIIGCLFGIVCAFFFFRTPATHIFDRQKRLYLVKGKSIRIDLDHLIAIQLLFKDVYDGEYFDYRVAQINLCFEDGTRHRTICHSGVEELENDAAQLAVFLNVPLATVNP